MSAARVADSALPPPPKPRTFRGRYDPYITVAELRDLLNEAANGESRWTTIALRAGLRDVGAVTQLPAARGRTPRTSRRLWVTTRALLREKAPELYTAILTSLPDTE